ncbi:MAG: SecD/SecF family protein translocase subunit, partial [Clostridia bacterium]|nr:SecD/SecF family protein translocase subunit [Clostridia bacterium]
SPNVGEAITNGEAMISGNFTYEQANSLAIQIQGGALTVDLDIVEQSNASATLGENAITTSLLAAGIGLLLIFVFMFLVYGGLGLVADISLCIYSVIVIYILGTFSVVQLSLAGIAGIVLSIGMAVDANVIIFERIKDEYAMGKNIPASVQAGFKRATAAIVDSNITTIIACAVLYFLGSATIKAFAITLFVGIIVSMVCALLISRGLCSLFLAINNTDNKFYKLESEVNING